MKNCNAMHDDSGEQYLDDVADGKYSCPLHIPSLEATWRDVENNDFKQQSIPFLHELPNKFHGPQKSLNDMQSKVNASALTTFQKALQEGAVGICTIDGSAQALQTALEFKSRGERDLYKCFCIDPEKAIQLLRNYEVVLKQ